MTRQEILDTVALATTAVATAFMELLTLEEANLLLSGKPLPAERDAELDLKLSGLVSEAVKPISGDSDSAIVLGFMVGNSFLRAVIEAAQQRFGSRVLHVHLAQRSSRARW